MGPEPMTRTERRSSRLGIRSPVHQGAERVELARGVVRPRRGFWVILDAECRCVQQPYPFDHPIVEVDVADLCAPEGRVKRRRRMIMRYGRPAAIRFRWLGRSR